MKNNGIKEGDINEVPALTGISQILTNKVDAKMAYEMNDSVLLGVEGKEVNITVKKVVQEKQAKVEKE